MKYEGIEKEIEKVLEDYKRAINDIKLSLEEVMDSSSDIMEIYDEFDNFLNVELNEILNGLDLD